MVRYISSISRSVAQFHVRKRQNTGSKVMGDERTFEVRIENIPYILVRLSETPNHMTYKPMTRTTYIHIYIQLPIQVPYETP